MITNVAYTQFLKNLKKKKKNPACNLMYHQTNTISHLKTSFLRTTFVWRYSCCFLDPFEGFTFVHPETSVVALLNGFMGFVM
jgi:hypothetical protein